jgi:iron complex transport system substrate-binding protein
MNNRRLAIKVLSVSLVAMSLGCGIRQADMPASGKELTAGDPLPRTLTDSFGHSLTISRRPARIVSTAPSTTEILFAVGAGQQVVGVTTYCNYPSEAGKCDKVGGFTPKSISIERIVGLRPDLVLTTGRLQQPLSEELRKLEIPTLSFDAKNLENVIDNIRSIGQASGHSEEADALARELDHRLSRVQERFATLPAADRPRVLLLLSEDMLMTAGPKTFAGQMLELAGGRNVFADVEQQFPRVSEEEIIKRNPSAVVLWAMGNGAPPKGQLGKRPGWDQIDAFRNQRILAIDDDLLSRAGPRLFDGLEKMADLLHATPDQGKK